jgi:hypothetical protein
MKFAKTYLASRAEKIQDLVFFRDLIGFLARLILLLNILGDVKKFIFDFGVAKGIQDVILYLF